MTEKIDHNIKIYESKNYQIRKIVYAFILYIFLLAIKEKSYEENFWIIGFLSLVLLYYIYRRVKKLNKPAKKIIVISVDGISVAPYGFIGWENIKSEYINARGNAPYGMDYFFEFKTKNNVIIEIPGFGLTKNIFQIRNIVKRYRNHYEEYVIPKYD